MPPARTKRGRRLRHSFWVLYLAVGVTAIGCYYLLPSAGRAQAGMLDSINLSAALCALVAARRYRGRARLIWGALAVAMLFSTSANVPYYAFPLATGHALPFPTAVDGFWLGTYPCFALVLLALSLGQRRQDRHGDALDAAIFITCGAALMWEFVIGPVVASTGLRLAAHIVAIAYPAMDLVVFALLVRLVISTSWHNGAMRILTGSFVALLVGDTVYSLQLGNGTYHFGGIPDGFWMLSYLLIGVAATHSQAGHIVQRRSAAPTRLSTRRLLFLSSSVLIGPVLILIRPQDLPEISLATALSFLLVMARVTSLNRQLASLSVEMHARATTDALTGLANRASFHDTLGSRLAHREAGDTLAVMFVDLDDFKDVNDTLGHAAGDRLLQVVAGRLITAVRPNDLVARLGGDEFAVLLTDLSERDSAESIARRTVAGLATPVTIGRQVVQVAASIGVTHAQSDSTLVEILREADVAMYSAKRNGKNRVECYDAAQERAHDELANLNAEILNAASRSQLVVEYQPIMDLASGNIAGFEALVRWQHPDRGYLPPSAFISAAEETGAIIDIGEHVLHTAAEQVHAWQQRYSRPELSVSVNVSVRQLEEPAFLGRVQRVLAETGLPAHTLILEVTESVLAKHTDGLVAYTLDELRAAGIRIALDDFGVGFNSLSYLHHFNVDILKIDRSFVSGDRGERSAALLEGIIELGLRLGLELIPEGIEQDTQLAHLQELGCRVGQGFLLARPSPAAVIEAELTLARASVPAQRSVPLRHRQNKIRPDRLPGHARTLAGAPDDDRLVNGPTP